MAAPTTTEQNIDDVKKAFNSFATNIAEGTKDATQTFVEVTEPLVKGGGESYERAKAAAAPAIKKLDNATADVRKEAGEALDAGKEKAGEALKTGKDFAEKTGGQLQKTAGDVVDGTQNLANKADEHTGG